MTQKSHNKPRQPLGWVLVANAARARSFMRDAENGAMKELASFVHPSSRLKGQELESDRGGKVRKSAASTQFAPHTDTHDKEHEQFARELAQYLEEAALSQGYPDLALFASTAFLGVLRAHLGPSTLHLLRASLPLDLTTYQAAELEQRVARALQAATA